MARWVKGAAAARLPGGTDAAATVLGHLATNDSLHSRVAGIPGYGVSGAQRQRHGLLATPASR